MLISHEFESFMIIRSPLDSFKQLAQLEWKRFRVRGRFYSCLVEFRFFLWIIKFDIVWIAYSFGVYVLVRYPTDILVSFAIPYVCKIVK